MPKLWHGGGGDKDQPTYIFSVISQRLKFESITISNVGNVWANGIS